MKSYKPVPIGWQTGTYRVANRYLSGGNGFFKCFKYSGLLHYYFVYMFYYIYMGWPRAWGAGPPAIMGTAAVPGQLLTFNRG